MSPSWRDRRLIGLAPGHACVIEVKRGLRPALGADGVRACAEVAGNPWAGALTALDGLLEEMALTNGSASVVLSNQFARFVEVPWTPGVHKESDRLALAANCLSSVHGEAASQWRIILEAARFGAGSLAAAVDGSLIDGLRTTLAKRKTRLASLRPHLAVAFDRWRQKLQADDGGFAVVEPGCVTALFRRGQSWSAVANRRYRNDSVEEAVKRLRQCVDADRMSGGEGGIALVAPGVADLPAAGERPLRRLSGLGGPWPEDPWRTLAWSAS